MRATDIKPIDLQTLPMQALQPLHEALDPALSDKQRELVEAVFVGLTNSAAAQACTPRVLAEAAVTAFVQVCHVLGGGQFYMTKLENLRRGRMNRAIHAGFNGRNHALLAREHGITENRVRQILNPKSTKGRK